MNINGIGNFTSDPFYVCPQGCAESKADVFGALTPEENLVFARESSVCKAAIARNIISGTTGGSFQMKKYKSDIGPIQSSYSNVEANEILGKSFKAQSIFFDFKEDGYECIPELVHDIRIEFLLQNIFAVTGVDVTHSLILYDRDFDTKFSNWAMSLND